jgi:Holliday junction resolvasome RuvABC DNA-binding subunit
MELLLSLGYKRKEVEKALSGFSFHGLSPEEALKLALKRLSGEFLDRKT